MLNRPTNDLRLVRMLASLEGDERFTEVVKWMRDSREHLTASAAEEKDEVQLRWMQGAIQALGEFLQYADTAKDVVYRVNQREKDPRPPTTGFV